MGMVIEPPVVCICGRGSGIRELPPNATPKAKGGGGGGMGKQIDGVGDAAKVIPTSGGPTFLPSAASGVQAISLGIQNSKWEALLKFPPLRTSGKSKCDQQQTKKITIGLHY